METNKPSREGRESEKEAEETHDVIYSPDFKVVLESQLANS